MDILAFIGAALLFATTAAAQESSSNRVSASTDWSVFVEENPKECWSVSTPTETVNTRDGRVVAANRGEIRSEDWEKNLFIFMQNHSSLIVCYTIFMLAE